MNKNIKFGIKIITFLLVLIICFRIVTEIVVPKYYYNEVYSATNTFGDFYNLRKDSVDVLFFGSSHAACSFNPLVLYDNYGITSYNLASEEQSVLVTYYWLEEALKYQSPKVVVIDTYTFFRIWGPYAYNDLNCSEGSIRKGMDYMRISPTKIHAALDIERLDPTQDKYSILFPILRYHTRWNNLDEEDFIEQHMIAHGAIKGYAFMGDRKPGAGETSFDSNALSEIKAEPLVPVAEKYIDKIVECCNKNGVKLIFTNIPCSNSAGRYKTLKQYADAHDIPYFDFNEKKLYDEIGYVASENLTAHPNYLGAEKISLYIGEMLQRDYSILPREDDSYNAAREVYEHKLKNAQLNQTEDVYNYLNSINDADYSVFIFGPKDYSKSLDETAANLLSDLGVTENLLEKEVGIHYCFVKDCRNVIEKDTYDDFSISGAIRGGTTTYNITIDTSNQFEDRRTYSLVIDGVECGNSDKGLDIVVYDNDFRQIVSRANIDRVDEKFCITHY